MADQKLTDRSSLSTSSDVDLLHVVKSNNSYKQKKSDFLKEDRVVLGTHTSQISTHTSQIAGLTTNNVGSLSVADTPTQDGIYIAEESGTYTNAGGLVVDLTSTLVYISVSGSQSTFDLIEIPISTLGYYIVSSLASFDALISGATEGHWVFISDITLDANKIIPSGVTLHFNSGSIDLNSFSITGNDTQIKAGLVQIFTTSGSIVGKWDVDANPQWFGAIGNGVFDNTDAFNAVLQLKNVKVPKGDYLITDEIDIISNVTIKGEIGTVFTGLTTLNKSYFNLNASLENVILKDFEIDASTRGDSTAAIGMIESRGSNNIDNLKISNITILTGGTYNSGIDFESSTGGLISDLHIENCKVICTGDAVYGIRIEKESKRMIVEGTYVSLTNSLAYNAITSYEDSTDFKITNNTVTGSGHSGIAVSPASFGSIIGNRVSGVNSVNEAGIEVEWKSTHGDFTSKNITIVGNIVDDCNFGIYVTKRDQVIADDIPNIIITSNVVTNTITAGIKVAYMNNSVVSSNTINDANNIGISINSCNKINVNNNVINSVSHGIYNAILSEGILIQNNNINIQTGASGIYAPAEIIGYNISDNIINFEDGLIDGSSIRIALGSKGLVVGNITTGAVSRSIQLGTVTDSEFYNNYFENASSYSAPIGSPNSVKYFNNTGIPDTTLTISIDGGAEQTTALKLINDKNVDQDENMTVDIDFYLKDDNVDIETPQARIGVFGTSVGNVDAEAGGQLGFYTNIPSESAPVLTLAAFIDSNQNLNLLSVPIFADDASASSLATGVVYKTANGELRIKL